MRNILIVCTANICRSPMVEGLVQAQLEAEGLTGQVTVSSAGVFAAADDPADLIVVMEEAQRQAIFYRQPQLLSKVYLLSELAGEHDDLSDPHGGPEAGYWAVLAQAQRWVDGGWERIVAKEG